MTPALIKQLKAARRVSVPVVSITTPDPAATVRAIVLEVVGDAKSHGKPVAVLAWDVVEGVRGANEAGKAVRDLLIDEMDPTVGNPVALLTKAKQLPPGTVLIVHAAGRFVADPMTVQAAWNLRDLFKSDTRTLVLLTTDAHWPAEISGDVVSLDEPLPDAQALCDIITKTYGSAALEVPERLADINKIVEAVQGLPAFQAEQVIAMSLTTKGVDVSALWERKRQQIELTPGLKVHRDPTTFADIGGVPVVKDFLTRVMHGQARPNAVVFVDEIEKFLAGAGPARGGAADSSGVSQDQLGQLLSYMQDQNASGLIFVGPPGAAKSAVAKAAGNEAGIPTIQLDLGAMKGGLVGASEQNLRAALKVVTSVSNGRSLWIATCNSIGDLPPELRRRFTLGTFFFDLPDEAERKAIWNIWFDRYDFKGAGVIGKHVDDAGWTGAEIRQCCDIAWRLGCTLKEAAGFVVPVSRSAAEQLDKLRRAAEGRFLSASRPGVYRREDSTAATKPANGRRKLELEEA